MPATGALSKWSWMNETAADAASPASFQPLKAQTMIGLRSSGRSLQTTSLMAVTVPDAASDHPCTMGPMSTAVGDPAAIAELRPGGDLSGVFACSRKDRLVARNGAPYLAVELRDRTGAVSARAFRDADFLASQFERGDLVQVAGRAERFRDELVIELGSIRRAP